MSNLTELAKQFADFKSKHDALSAQLKDLTSEWNACEEKLLEAMVEEGTKSVELEGLGTFTLTTTNYLSVNAANKPTFYPYLKASGNGALLKEDVNPRTLTAFLKEHLEEITRKYELGGLDAVDARKSALEFLNQKGASYFSKREIRMRK